MYRSKETNNAYVVYLSHDGIHEINWNQTPWGFPEFQLIENQN